jgi:hypothetical protein
MKKLLLICGALALAGCNSKPGNGDIEDFLEPLFATCTNIKFTSASKLNGYGEPDAYHVQFKYTVKVDSDNLDKLHKAYLHDMAAGAESVAQSKEYEEQKSKLQAELESLEKDFENSKPRPQPADFGGEQMYSLSPTQDAAFRAASSKWYEERRISVAHKKVALDDLEADYRARQGLRTSQFGDTTRVGNVLSAFYERGCTWPAGRYMTGIFHERFKDPAELFDRRKIEMESELTFMKTEQGWRVIR